MDNDTSRPAATGHDKHTFTIEHVADRYSAAGHARTIRTLQRYCVTGHLDCLKAPTYPGLATCTSSRRNRSADTSHN